MENGKGCKDACFDDSKRPYRHPVTTIKASGEMAESFVEYAFKRSKLEPLG